MDELTGVMGRRMFLYHCEKAQKENGARAESMGWFLFVDVDYFKEINDTFGHGIGDKVLREIAGNLHDIFGAQMLEAFDLKFGDEYKGTGQEPF